MGKIPFERVIYPLKGSDMKLMHSTNREMFDSYLIEYQGRLRHKDVTDMFSEHISHGRKQS